MRPKLVERPGDDVVHLARVADVAGERQRAAPLRAHRVGDRLERGQAAAHRHHVGPDLGHLDGDGAADALAGAGDDGDAVLQGVLCEGHRQTIAATAPAANPALGGHRPGDWCMMLYQIQTMGRETPAALLMG